MVNRGFWSLTHSWEYPWSSQSFPSDRTASVSSINCTVTKRLRSSTWTCASSFVCTSPVAVSTTVVFLDLRKASNSCELNSFVLIMWCSWSTTNSRSCADFEVGAGITLASIEEKRSLVRLLELVKYARQIPCYSAGASFLVQGLLMWSFSQFWQARTTLMRFTLWDTSSRWTLSFFLVWCQVSLENLTECFVPNIPFPRRIDYLGTESWDTQPNHVDFQWCNWSFRTPLLWPLAGLLLRLNMSEEICSSKFASSLRLIVLTHKRMPNFTWRFFFVTAWNFAPSVWRAFISVAWCFEGFFSLAVSLGLRTWSGRGRSSFSSLTPHKFPCASLSWLKPHEYPFEHCPCAFHWKHSLTFNVGFLFWLLVTAPLYTTSFRTLTFRVLIISIWRFTRLFNRK